MHQIIEPQRLRKWRDEVARRLIGLDFRPTTDNPLRLRLTPLLEHSDLKVALTSFSPGTSFRDAELARDVEGLAFPIAMTPVDATCRGQNTHLKRGEACLIPLDEPASLSGAAGFTAFGISVSRRALEERGLKGNPQICSRITDVGGGLALLRGYLRAVERQASRGMIPLLAREHILDLIAYACTSQAQLGHSHTDAATSARYVLALEYLNGRFSDPDLSLEDLAQSMRISTRYLQVVFERMDTSFTRILTKIRLEQAAALLRETSDPPLTIATIAYSVGYSDLSHFYRVFRSRFGVAPGEMRSSQVRDQIRFSADFFQRETHLKHLCLRTMFSSDTSGRTLDDKHTAD